MTDKEIIKRAQDVNKGSLYFHLSHAVAAANLQVRDALKQYSASRIGELKRALDKARKAADDNAIDSVCKDIGALERPGQICVEYVSPMSKNGGRAIKVDNSFVISLPMSLAKKSVNDDGSYNAEALATLRHRIAHELGHIILHTEKLLSVNGMQGTVELTSDTEREANIFANELLRLRDERNKQLVKSKAV